MTTEETKKGANRRVRSSVSMLAALSMLLGAAGAFAADFEGPATTREEFKYSWRLRGALSWIAGIAFPIRGAGALRTRPAEGETFESELLITAGRNEPGYYVYRSMIDRSGEKTLESYHGYAWGKKQRHEKTFFDYVRRLARIREETESEVETDVKPIPDKDMRDVLTGIYYLRRHAGEISAPMTTEIYSDGKIYPVVFRPIGRETMAVGKQRVEARGFEITAAPDQKKKFPGGVKVWLTDDARSVPVRIEIVQSYASLQLELQSLQ